jgi:hypothetical protein
MQWGDRHLSDKPPRIARRRSDQFPVSVRLVAKDGSIIAPGELELIPGPGAPPARPSKRKPRDRQMPTYAQRGVSRPSFAARIRNCHSPVALAVVRSLQV